MKLKNNKINKKVTYYIVITSVSIAIAILAIFLTYQYIITNTIDFGSSFFGNNTKRLWVVGIIILVIIRSFSYALGAWSFLKTYSFDKKIHWYQFIPLAMQMTFIQVITPFTFGSQPWAVFYLKMKGFSLKEIIPSIMARDSIYQICLFTIPLIFSPHAIAINFQYLGYNTLFITLFIIGLFIDFLFAVFLFAAGLSNKFQQGCVWIVHWFRSKLLPRARQESNIDKWYASQQLFHENFVKNLKNIKAIIIVIILMFCYIYSSSVLLYFCGQYSNGKEIKINYYLTSSMATAAYSAAGTMPIPGGLGIQELLLKEATLIGFINNLNNINETSKATAENAQFNAINAWRLWGSYVPGAIGILFLIIDLPILIIYHNKWKQKNKIPTNLNNNDITE